MTATGNHLRRVDATAIAAPIAMNASPPSIIACWLYGSPSEVEIHSPATMLTTPWTTRTSPSTAAATCAIDHLHRPAARGPDSATRRSTAA
ncbi:hypothetical protein SAMN04488548_136559 [Gordonia westfalica]|uniref:Uncharacterized protein n=1 Tax=Gordonia westfalica TaxID=158898 RepID=A0A1H2LM58_9ACTN|nr:hypothetical protein SAMN04488548_136559 [Gordonia westfalica]